MLDGTDNQAVTATPLPEPLRRLLVGKDGSLADWYATPLMPATARWLLAAGRDAVQARLRRGDSQFTLLLLQQIARFWLADGGADIAPAPAAPRERALAELVRGQLLASCKLNPAPSQLARGFRLAAAYLETPDYFRLLREHELLGYLPYADSAAPARDLPELLTEAAVIVRLQRGCRRAPVWPHMDTLG